MALNAVVVDTGLRNDDGSSRWRVIRRRCAIGGEVVLRKAKTTRETSRSVAVYLAIPRLFGLLRSSYAQIGYLDAQAAAALAARLESSGEILARVQSVYAPEEKDSPRVSLIIE